MIKGVNKQFIEVSDTGSRYFERALLVVRPEFTSLPYESLKGEAKRTLDKMGEPEKVRRENAKNQNRAAAMKRRRLLRLLYTLLICAVGITIGIIISKAFM